MGQKLGEYSLNQRPQIWTYRMKGMETRLNFNQNHFLLDNCNSETNIYIALSLSLFLCLYLSVSLFLYLSLCLFICLSVSFYLSLSLSLSLSLWSLYYLFGSLVFILPLWLSGLYIISLAFWSLFSLHWSL